MWVWELKPGPLEEQQLLLPAEPSLCSPKCVFLIAESAQECFDCFIIREGLIVNKREKVPRGIGKSRAERKRNRLDSARAVCERRENS